MKKQFLKMTMMAIILSIGFIACEKEEVIEGDSKAELNEEPTKDAVLPTEVSQDFRSIAKVQKDGHEFNFIALGQEDEMVVVERLYGEALINQEKGLINDKEKTAFDVFAQVTAQNVLVPNRIAMTANKDVLKSSGRQVLKSEEYLEILDDAYAELTEKAACYNVGATNFRNTYCNAPVSSTPSNIEFCDEGARTSPLTRSSYFGGAWRELDDTRTWTNVICGRVRVQFYAWEKDGIWPWSDYKWFLKYQVDFDNGIWWANYLTSTNTERKVVRTRISSNGSYRSYTRFH
ncbi:hypothetical protein [Aquimarina aggregata]|uniref:hypothetical protein n=1 Tax=Aquimarina aggregata TaxID=1642818 RepID=UPI002490E78A|nr:hypothetical protein [Aquimarina aggregata]